MENKANYTLIGVFSILFLTAFAASVLWLGKIGINDEYDSYIVLATESVSGLNVEAPVKYRGVVVGKVSEVKIYEQNSELIELTLEIKKGTPIRESSMASLKPQGVTGLSFVDITPGDSKSPLLLSDDDNIATIKYSESIFGRLDSSFTTMTDRLGSILFKIDTALSQKNMNEIGKTLQNIQRASFELDMRLKELGALGEESKGLPTEAKNALAKFSKAVLRVDAATGQIESSFERGDFDYKKDIEKVSLEMQKLLSDMRELTAQTNTLVKDIQKNPSSLIFEDSGVQRGPGE